MSKLSSSLPLAALLCAAQSITGTASAHIHLLEPIPRYPDEVSGENKNCPCGVGTAGRACGKPEERSDPNRSADRATALTGGSMLTVRFDEYVGHGGRYRVAFDTNGADLSDFNANILLDVPDPRGAQGNVGDGSIWELQVRVPNVDCDNCTLQLIQMMDGDTENPVPDPVGRSSYYQCADVVITKDASIAADEIVDGVVPESAPPSSPPVAPPDAGMPSGAAGSSTLPVSVAAVEDADSTDGGCSLSRRPPHAPGWQPLALVAAALLYGSRRRRALRTSAPR